ncbi:MAG: hypothetical protein U1E76_14595 [Planctomycetota bacterium]
MRQDSSQGLTINPVAGSPRLEIASPEFAGEVFVYTVPEAIGPADDVTWAHVRPNEITPEWNRGSSDVLSYAWRRPGQFALAVQAAANHEHVDVQIKLSNISQRSWPVTLAFCCMAPRGAPSFVDFDGTRTEVLLDDAWQAITRLPRRDSPRPTVQLWYLQDGPRKIPVVESFAATPACYPSGAIAVRARGGGAALMLTSDRPLFLFSNLEYGCVHCCPGFGPLAPNESRVAVQRIFITSPATPELLTKRARALWQ